ncbi:MAG: peptide chain release factor N(5)-glutamine methyltransferase [Bacillota bacterium]|nr:MAG: peptide chain release factor N(5)-glutamine methyltransferase [Bacillota bacterium]
MKKSKKEKKTSVGGQAVMEGVMMRGRTAMATAVRDEDGVIRMESVRLTPPEKRNKFAKLPVVRGVVNFVSSMVTGMKTLMRSAEVFGEGEPSKFEKWMAKKFKINIMSVVLFLSALLGVALAVGLFIVLPQLARRGIELLVGGGFEFGVLAKNFIEGGFKILVFVGYILLISLMKDVRRLFMYHGAEHKTISCYEKDLPLTPENAKTCSRIHDRCGTTFMVFVIVISILVFALAESLFALYGMSVEKIWRVLLKIALLPFVAGISYELLKGLAKTDSKIVLPLKWPGMLLQKITTREPDDEMLEVAIAAFGKVMELDADPSLPTEKFVVAKKRGEVTEEVKKRLLAGGIEESAEAEWLVSLTLGVKRSEAYTDNLVSPKNIDKINSLVEQRLSGRPLWYCVGDTEFYGYKIKTDERALIPRCETEELVERALKRIEKESEVLDLCTGSGAIAVAVQKKSGAKVTAADVSADALALARENAAENQADVEFVQSDLFAEIDGAFDVIVSNPPYIKSEDIDGLQREIKDFEPRIALDGGADGLDFYRRIAKDAPAHIKAGGALFLECGETQAEEIAAMFEKAEIFKDLEGKERIVKAEF